MKKTGIEGILVLCNICGRDTANKVMAGKYYYKMMRYHSWEVRHFFMLIFEAFEESLVEEHKDLKLFNRHQC